MLIEISLWVIIVKFLATTYNIFAIICPKIFKILFFKGSASEIDWADLTYAVQPKPMNFKSLRQLSTGVILRIQTEGKTLDECSH